MTHAAPCRSKRARGTAGRAPIWVVLPDIDEAPDSRLTAGLRGLRAFPWRRRLLSLPWLRTTLGLPRGGPGPGTRLLAHRRWLPVFGLVAFALVFGAGRLAGPAMGTVAMTVVFLVTGTLMWTLARPHLTSRVERMLPVAVLLAAGGNIALLISLANVTNWPVVVPIGYLAIAVPLALGLAAEALRRRQWPSEHLAGSRALVDAAQLSVAAAVLYWTIFAVPVLSRDTGVAAEIRLSLLSAMSVVIINSPVWVRTVRCTGHGLVLLTLCTMVTTTGTWLYSSTWLRLGGDPATQLTLGAGVLAAGVSMVAPALCRRAMAPRVTIRSWWFSELGPLFVQAGAWLVGGIGASIFGFDRWTAALVLASFALYVLRMMVVRVQEHRLERDLAQMAYLDPLTRVANRRFLTERLAGTDGWLLTIDLDRFKDINDRFGYEAGDEVLMGLADRVALLLPDGAALARIGGDEFAVLLDGDRDGALRLAHEVAAAGRDTRFSPVTASVGVAPVQRSAPPEESLLAGDIAMREAKHRGTDGVALLDSAMRAGRRREYTLGRALAADLAAGRLHVAYQPIYRLEPQPRAVAVEALARWSHPEYGAVPPAEFIAIAERMDLIDDLGALVLEHALDQLRRWQVAGLSLDLCVNLSAAQLRTQPGLAAVAERFAACPEVASSVVLELTETVFAEDEEVVESLGMLRELGLRVAIDDFGTGASTLYSLRQLPVDVLKIDQRLIADLTSTDDAVVDLIVRLADRLGTPVVAEGVQTPDQLRVLQAIGCPLAQGYLLNPPLEPSDIARVFAS